MRPTYAFVVALALAFVPGDADAFRIPTPWGDIQGKWSEVLTAALDPQRYIQPAVVPTPMQLAEFVVNNPDQLFELFRSPQDAATSPAVAAVVAAIVAGRNSVVAKGGMPIPDEVMRRLRPWHTGRLLDSVRWTTNWNLAERPLQTAQMFRERHTRAITLMNAIIFRTPEDANDLTLWAHELYHVTQYDDLGVTEFAKRWIASSGPSGAIEAPAYEREEAFRKFQDEVRRPTSVPIATNVNCRTAKQVDGKVSPSMAICDLFLATNAAPQTFRIEGRASANGHGKREGLMRLAMTRDASMCNSQGSVDVGVDNQTILSGSGYVCMVALSPGESARIVAIAPNIKADADYIQLEWKQ